MASVQQIVMHPYVSQLLKFWSTTVGRDKSARTVQYLSRFLAWYYMTVGAPKESVARFSSIKSNIGLSRKLFRIGKFLEHFQAALKATSISDAVVRFTAIGRQLGYAMYLILDALQWAHGAKAVQFSKETYERISKNAARFWLTGLTFSLISGVYKSYNLAQRAKWCQRPRATPEKEAERRVELHQIAADTKAVRLQMFQDCCDWVNPGTSTGWINANDGIIGIAGTISSSLGARSQWIKVNGSPKK
ncbi:Peroxisomal membrane protein PMP27 [Malassezia vespertilionis]|uniref:Pex11p n=1 Tax=Malassezia vespertilionis TaxID=2020962 RepID=A0A2N1J777_9BASI|nr:Peroxisomal membrane protein PMP27 [Malassezia vespertilionis]PKI82401.1 Pex11p [Malassezia vespertilionis]WFD07983.1 Peroxisomal membrane protein PMP27 [Malassezia vespertilionis]